MVDKNDSLFRFYGSGLILASINVHSTFRSSEH